MAVSKPLLTEFGIHHRLEKCVAQFNPFLLIMFERGMVFGYQIRNELYLAQLFLCSRTYQGRKKRVGWSRKRVTRRCVQSGPVPECQICLDTAVSSNIDHLIFPIFNISFLLFFRREREKTKRVGMLAYEEVGRL